MMMMRHHHQPQHTSSKARPKRDEENYVCSTDIAAESSLAQSPQRSLASRCIPRASCTTNCAYIHNGTMADGKRARTTPLAHTTYTARCATVIMTMICVLYIICLCAMVVSLLSQGDAPRTHSLDDARDMHLCGDDCT